jgi:CubicO group peptidase (beta-lactamase class C family)
MSSLNRAGLARIRDVLQSHVEERRIPGAVAVVALGGHVELFEALGHRDPATGAPMKSDAIFRIYSMTKPLVSLAALMLAEEGRLQLVDPVSRYLPEFAGPKVAVEEGGVLRLEPVRREPTVHDLLRHTAGFTYEFLGGGAVRRQYDEARIYSRARSNAEFCKALATIPLAFQPGSCWEYSRATDVLGALLEAVTGRPLGELLRERIFRPLDMKDTTFGVSEPNWQRIAEPFAIDPASGQPVVLFNAREAPKFESGGGGLLSTAGDYLRFLQLMRNGGTLDGCRLVSRSTVAWMTSDHLGGVPVQGEQSGDLLLPGHGFGLGFAVRTHPGLAPQPGSPGQYFWGGMAGTLFFVDPVQDLIALLLTQAPNQRVYYRGLIRHLVYAALD